MINFRSFVPLLILFTVIRVMTQTEINGSADFEVSAAGSDSKFIVNEIANEYTNPHLSISQLNLFVFSPINENFSFNMRVQFDTWGSGRLNNLRLTLAMLTWEAENSQISLSVGRYISPFGLYPRRQLAADNLFANAPLAYGYFINISDIKGFWPAAGRTGVYLSDDVGLTTIYFGGYNTGALATWTIVPDILNLDLGVANAALASQADYTNLGNAAGIIRLGFSPLIFWQQGISVSYGSFLQSDPLNSNYNNLTRFSQLVAGTDLILAYSYFEISGEFIYSKWQVPGFDNGTYKESSPGKLAIYDLENYSAYTDIKFEPPFLTGSYLAFRYDILRFLEYQHPNSTSRITLNPWDYNIDRYSAAIGYKFARSVLLKIAYSNQTSKDPTIGNQLYTIRGILTVSF
jgi:hypothetical protein